MYFQIADRLVVSGGSSVGYSQAVTMDGANAAQVNVTVFTAASGGSAILQESNDLENWTNVSGGTAIVLGYTTFKGTAIASQYVRLMFPITSGTEVVSAGVNTANL